MCKKRYILLQNMEKSNVINLIKSIYFKLFAVRQASPCVIDRLKTSELLVQNERLSLVRFGDGELGIVINQQDVGFQKYELGLQKRLYEILNSEEDENILICIPDVFGNSINNLKQEPKKYWIHWIKDNRNGLRHLINKKRLYGDSLVSRLYLPWIDKSDEQIIVENLKKTWEQKHVVIVEGEKTRWGVGNDLLNRAKSVKRILCPVENAYDKYDEIFSICMKYKYCTDVYILALGPTATVLAYDFAKSGIRTLDLGHFDLQYEYLVKKSEDRMKIKGKYNNEIHDLEVENCDDDTYMKSIVARIDVC